MEGCGVGVHATTFGVLKRSAIFTVIPQVYFVVCSGGLRSLILVSETENIETEKQHMLFMTRKFGDLFDP